MNHKEAKKFQCSDSSIETANENFTVQLPEMIKAPVSEFLNFLINDVVNGF
jgi:hypothetical protein